MKVTERRTGQTIEIDSGDKIKFVKGKFVKVDNADYYWHIAFKWILITLTICSIISSIQHWN